MKLSVTILKYPHSWYLCQISLEIMLLPNTYTNYSISMGNEMVTNEILQEIISRVFCLKGPGKLLPPQDSGP